MSQKASHPLPGDPSLAPLEDRTEYFKEISKANPVPEEATRAFIANRFRMLASDPALSDGQKKAAHESLAMKLGKAAVSDQPVPGGVGYGMFYTSAFKTAYNLGTKLQFDYICPATAGGNVNTWLYLTATNRASHGVEALVAYYAQNQMSFMAFDWAQPGDKHWQLNIPYANLKEYFVTVVLGGVPYPGIAVENVTAQVQTGTWRNTVSLFNIARQGYDLVYSYDYATTEADQKTGWVGSWGPIVETFQDSYTGTALMGVFITELASQDSSGVWGGLGLLSADQATVRVDNKGFSLDFIDPQSSWAVKS